MTFKRYLSIDQAIAYLSENQPFNSELKDLQELERFGQIKPLIYLTDVFFSKDITIGDTEEPQAIRSDVSVISGYFKPSNFIFLDRYTLNPYREFQDEYFELKIFDSLEIEHLTSNSDKLSQGDKGNITGNNDFSDQLVTEVPCELVFISKAELDALLSSETKEDDKTINELNQRIKQLEQQLEQSSQKQGQHEQLTDRSEQSYLTTIGLLLELMTAPKGIENKPPFQSQSVIIAEIEDKGIYGQRRSSLEGRFGDANKALDNAKKKG